MYKHSVITLSYICIFFYILAVCAFFHIMLLEIVIILKIQMDFSCWEHKSTFMRYIASWICLNSSIMGKHLLGYVLAFISLWETSDWWDKFKSTLAGTLIWDSGFCWMLMEILSAEKCVLPCLAALNDWCCLHLIIFTLTICFMFNIVSNAIVIVS